VNPKLKAEEWNADNTDLLINADLFFDESQTESRRMERR
jgi:hypothetical protein